MGGKASLSTLLHLPIHLFLLLYIQAETTVVSNLACYFGTLQLVLIKDATLPLLWNFI